MADSLKFFTDVQIAKQVTLQLQNKGVDIIRCQDIGMMEASDEELLIYATEHQRAMVSFDKDFTRIHDEWLEVNKLHGGIFRILPHLEGQNGIGTIVTSLLEYYQLIDEKAGTLEEDIENQIIFIG